MFAFLFTDIEGSTVLLQRVGGDVYARVLVGHHGLIRSALAAHGGTEVDTAGDGFFAVFSAGAPSRSGPALGCCRHPAGPLALSPRT